MFDIHHLLIGYPIFTHTHIWIKAPHLHGCWDPSILTGQLRGKFWRFDDSFYASWMLNMLMMNVEWEFGVKHILKPCETQEDQWLLLKTRTSEAPFYQRSRAPTSNDPVCLHTHTTLSHRPRVVDTLAQRGFGHSLRFAAGNLTVRYGKPQFSSIFKEEHHRTKWDMLFIAMLNYQRESWWTSQDWNRLH